MTPRQNSANSLKKQLTILKVFWVEKENPEEGQENQEEQEK